MPETNRLYFVPLSEIRILRDEINDLFALAKILAPILRINILYMIKRAGSGHIGTSFSSVDLMLWLWLNAMNRPNENIPNSDTFFSSKGHDAPALYAVLTALEKLPFELIHKLRKLGGLPGHPDIHTPFIATNTGSLGMGISKAKGMAIANRLNGNRARIFVLTGDGELQEGQIWESLQGAANRNLSEIKVIVDLNGIQSDTLVSQTNNMSPLCKKFESFGWRGFVCNGHDFENIQECLNQMDKEEDRPQVLFARTRKGHGVPFMERVDDDGLYKFHSGAPSDANYPLALEHLVTKANDELAGISRPELKLAAEEPAVQPPVNTPARETVISAFGKALAELGRREEGLVVLDADLAVDCGLMPFKKEFPARFIECGIAEQDMVSVAGGLARKGKIPVVNSFACFLSARPNEQIYNNATEDSKIIYVGSLAGLCPAGPGHSHQSVRDISALRNTALSIVQPLNGIQARELLLWAAVENSKGSYIRIANTPVPEELANISMGKEIKPGWSTNLIPGHQALILSYGQTITYEAYRAVLSLKESGVEVALDHMNWLNLFDFEWIRKNCRPVPAHNRDRGSL